MRLIFSERLKHVRPRNSILCPKIDYFEFYTITKIFFIKFGGKMGILINKCSWEEIGIKFIPRLTNIQCWLKCDLKGIRTSKRVRLKALDKYFTNMELWSFFGVFWELWTVLKCIQNKWRDLNFFVMWMLSTGFADWKNSEKTPDVNFCKVHSQSFLTHTFGRFNSSCIILKS